MTGHFRRERVAQAIRKNLSLIFLREYAETPLAGIIIQDVSASPDLREATVRYTLREGTPRRLAQERLAEEGKRIRHLLVKEMRHLRFAPLLHFRLDEKAESVVRLQELLDTLSREREEGDHDPAQ